MRRRQVLTLTTLILVLLGTGIAVAQQTGRLTLSDLEALIDDLMNENDAQQSQIDKLASGQTSQQGQIDKLANGQTSQQGQIDALSNGQSTQQSAIDALDTENDDQETRIATLEADNAALQSANAALQSRVDELEQAHPCDGGLCVFVTAATFSSNLGGPGGADNACREAARAAGLPGRYEAWISGSTEEATGQLLHTRVPYRRTDGALVAQDWADLTDGTIANPIDRTADGTQIVPQPGVTFSVWTGTATDGTVTDGSIGGKHCLNWTSGGSQTGTYGRLDRSSSDWTDAADESCAAANRLYCFQQ